MPLRDLITYMPENLKNEILKNADAITEIRIRAGHPVQIVGCDLDRFIGEGLDVFQVRKIALSMMDHSYYSRENELSQGFFTMRNGFRVGVCGGYIERSDGTCSLGNIGSLCIRIAREVPGCASGIVECLIRNGQPESCIILSRPGMGKTTILRDAARILSDMGWTVGIADERHEIAACRDGIPALNVGIRSDVVDGLTKAVAVGHLIRTMAPQVVVTDEIGDEDDIACLCEAGKKGVVVIASAHASSMEMFEKSVVGKALLRELFSCAVFLDGKPGNVAEVRRYD